MISMKFSILYNIILQKILLYLTFGYKLNKKFLKSDLQYFLHDFLIIILIFF